MATFRSRQRASHRREDQAKATSRQAKHQSASTPAADAPEQAPPQPAAPAVRRRLITPVTEASTRVQQVAQPADKPAMAAEPKAPAPAPVKPAAAQPERPAKSWIKARSDNQAAPDAPPRTPPRHAHAAGVNPRRGSPTSAIEPQGRPAHERRAPGRNFRAEPSSALALFASCPRGLEPVLMQELQRLGAENIHGMDGGIEFNGNTNLMMRLNLESRVASRVLLRVAHGSYRNERDINALAMQVDWPQHFDIKRTFKVKTDGVGAQLKSLEYVSLTVKDAVCDRFRQAQSARPNVDTHHPEIRIQVFLSPGEASIYLDSSGEALFKRGWRKESGEAPLRENLAAGILLLSGYDGSQPLLDPMCGSGTFLAEAADIALNRAPGRARRFAFEDWNTFDPAAWDALKQAARLAEKPIAALPIYGRDRDEKMIAIARANLERAGLKGVATLACQELFDSQMPAASGLIVTNPPYGVRLSEQEAMAAFYPKLGDWLKQHCAGWTAHILSADMQLPKLIRLSIKRRTPIYNGALACRIFSLPIIAGSARKSEAS